MTTPAFQAAVLDEIRGDLARADIPFGDIQAFARRVLQISRDYPDQLPEEALKPLIAEFPELTRALLGAVKRTEEERRLQALEDLKRRLSRE
jgi:hypothetical protein